MEEHRGKGMEAKPHPASRSHFQFAGNSEDRGTRRTAPGVHRQQNPPNVENATGQPAWVPQQASVWWVADGRSGQQDNGPKALGLCQYVT